MKKLLFLIAVILSSFTNSSAGHFVGGEITWECLSNGEYVFSMNLYRDCSGIPSTLQNETITIVGSPLPLNGVTSILVKPDLVRFAATNNGDLSAYCSSAYGSQASCAAGGAGVLQLLPYKSDPIRLTGTPPSSGWSFFYELPCCFSSNFGNVNASGNGLLRSIMLPVNNQRVDTCFSSSPTFVETPSGRFCRGDLVNYSNKAVSKDGDVLNYFSGPILAGSANNFTLIPYKSGFSTTNPTPSTAFNPLNVNYTLDSLSGDVSFAVHGGSFGNEFYTTNSEVRSYRNGVLSSIIGRTFPIVIGDCTPMPNGLQNTAPSISPPFISAGGGSFSATVMAGASLSATINISDIDTTGVGTGRQEITITPLGTSFSTNLVDPRMCTNPLDTSCATFIALPFIDTNQNPSKLAYKTLGSTLLFFSWQTDCNHLKADGTAKTHYFTMKATDDHCPNPKSVYKTIAITVLPSGSNCNLTTGILGVQSTFNSQVSLYPNPTHGQFNIDLDTVTEFVEVVIRNIRGQVVQQGTFTNQSRLDLNIDSDAGIYFIQLTNEKGERANMKVVKQ